jgi:hypothetical protein
MPSKIYSGGREGEAMAAVEENGEDSKRWLGDMCKKFGSRLIIAIQIRRFSVKLAFNVYIKHFGLDHSY